MQTDQTPTQVMRPATAGDLDQLVDLAGGIHELMTTMPRDPARMAERIEASQTSTAPEREVDGSESYFFVLEEDGQVTGTSAIYASVGHDRPFYNYKIGKRSQFSPELGVRADYRVLHPTNDYTGAAEVGTLYLSPDRRGGGRGRLLSLSRLLFLAVHQQRFGQRVVAELRGWTDESGASPFWDAVGAKFYGIDLQTADRRSGHDYRFIADLLPPYPIFIDLLPAEAQRVIGLPNTGSEPAARMLQRQGFRNNDYVDIFDAGLCLDAHIQDLEVVRNSSLVDVGVGEVGAGGAQALIARPGLEEFRVVQGPVRLEDGMVWMGERLRLSLGTEPGEQVLVYPLGTTATTMAGQP